VQLTNVVPFLVEDEGKRSRHAGCFSYIVAKDSADENVIWVTEAWESVTSHDASLSLPQ
jgi:quinol monooxygenase YgiN